MESCDMLKGMLILLLTLSLLSAFGPSPAMAAGSAAVVPAGELGHVLTADAADCGGDEFDGACPDACHLSSACFAKCFPPAAVADPTGNSLSRSKAALEIRVAAFMPDSLRWIPEEPPRD